MVAELSSKSRLHRQPRRHEPHERRDQVIETTSGPGGFLPRVPAGQPCLVMWSELDRDLRPGVPGAHDQHCSFLNLGWFAVLPGVELDDALIQLACE